MSKSMCVCVLTAVIGEANKPNGNNKLSPKHTEIKQIHHQVFFSFSYRKHYFVSKQAKRKH